MPPTPLRNSTLDGLRLIAAVGIVWFHTDAPGADIGYAGLPFFLMAMILLMAPMLSEQHGLPQPVSSGIALRRYTASRAARLLQPWLLWSGVYAALKLAQMQISGTTWADEFVPAMLLTGPAIHLWFLPFAFVACLTTALIWRAISRLPRLPVVLACLGLALLTTALGQAQNLPAPAAQWLYAAPAVCLGWAFVRIGATPMGVLSILAAFVVVAGTAGWTVGLLQITLAGLALAGCIALPCHATPLPDWAAGIAMGVYLIHPAVAAVLAHTTTQAPGTTGFALLTALISLATIAGTCRLTIPRKSRDDTAGSKREPLSQA